MIVAEGVKPLPGPKSFYGLKNIREMGQKGMLHFVAQHWQEYGDLFEVRVGPKKLVMVIHPHHVRHVTVTNGDNYDKLESYDPVRKYVIGDGLVTSTGKLWKRQRRLMAPFYTPRGVEEFSGIFLRHTLAMTERWQQLADDRSQVEMLDEMALITASIILKAVFSTESEQDILQIKESVMIILPYFTHRHPDFWQDPLRFEPDRHAPEAEKARHPQTYHPFAAGKRICLGNHFSLLETHMMLAILAHRFDPQLPPGYEADFVVAGILSVSNGLPMILKRR